MNLYISSCVTCGSIGRLVRKLKKKEPSLQIIETKFAVQQRLIHQEYLNKLWPKPKGLPPVVVVDEKPILLSEYFNEQPCELC
jgi:glutathione synthase/RimK-type ligase-like ATP-grasp enzyme